MGDDEGSKGARLGILFLSGGHCTLEMGQNILPILVPLFVPLFGLSFTQVALVSTVYLLTYSLIQPPIGRVIDKKWARRLPTIGLAWSAVIMAFSGLSPNYLALLVIVGAAGLGSGIFHPHGSSQVWSAGGAKKATVLSTFNLAGSLGYAAGPLLASAILLRVGTGGTIWLSVPAILMIVAMVARAASSPAPLPNAPSVRPAGLSTWRSYSALTTLSTIVILRSWSGGSLVLFLPLYLQGKGFTLEEGGGVLALLLILGALTGVAGGFLTDKSDSRTVIVYSTLLSAPLLLGFLLVPGVPGLALLILGYGSLLASLPVTQAMAQELLPSRAAFASGILGFGLGLGGIAEMLTGFMSDAFSLQVAFYVISAMPLLAGGLALFLPRMLAAAQPQPELARE